MNGLNLGCGPIFLEYENTVGWENSDNADTESSRSWKIDKARDFTKPMTDIGDQTIDYIVAWHIIEHVGLHENASLIKEWIRVLKPGGKLFIACPDLSKIAKHLVDRDGPWEQWYICMVNLFGPYNGSIGDYHKWGYNEEELKKLLTENGFGSVNPTSPQELAHYIGPTNAQKIGFADYNVQFMAIK